MKNLLLLIMVLGTMFSCTPEDGIDGINGVDGAMGPQGIQGIPGEDGQDGRDGVDGQDGRDGVDGQDGADGAQGPIGITGAQGADGQDGIDGAIGPVGPQGPNGITGADGYSWIAYADDYMSPWETTESALVVAPNNMDVSQPDNTPLWAAPIAELTKNGNVVGTKWVVGNTTNAPVHFGAYGLYYESGRYGGTNYYVLNDEPYPLPETITLAPWSYVIINVSLTIGFNAKLTGVRFSQISTPGGPETSPTNYVDFSYSAGSMPNSYELTPKSGLYLYGGYDLNRNMVLEDSEITLKELLVPAN